MAILEVAVVKGKGKVSIDTEAIPEAVFAEIVMQGLKVLVNRGTSKITKSTYPNEDELKTAALAQADKQVAAILDGTIKLTGQKKSAGASGKVMTEARRLAKNLIKDEIKRKGMKISHIEASVITKAANAYLETDQGKALITEAEENIAAREKVPVASAIDITALVSESPDLVAKAEARKKDKPLSAKQAGMVKSKAKGSKQPSANA